MNPSIGESGYRHEARAPSSLAQRDLVLGAGGHDRPERLEQALVAQQRQRVLVGRDRLVLEREREAGERAPVPRRSTAAGTPPAPAAGASVRGRAATPPAPRTCSRSCPSSRPAQLGVRSRRARRARPRTPPRVGARAPSSRSSCSASVGSAAAAGRASASPRRATRAEHAARRRLAVTASPSRTAAAPPAPPASTCTHREVLRPPRRRSRAGRVGADRGPAASAARRGRRARAAPRGRARSAARRPRRSGAGTARVLSRRRVRSGGVPPSSRDRPPTRSAWSRSCSRIVARVAARVAAQHARRSPPTRRSRRARAPSDRVEQAGSRARPRAAAGGGVAARRRRRARAPRRTPSAPSPGQPRLHGGAH